MNDKKLKAHLFICTNVKKNGACCGSLGSTQMRERLKNNYAERMPKGTIRINASGCLGHCEKGITAVLYPEGRWFTELKNSDDEKLTSAIEDALRS